MLLPIFSRKTRERDIVLTKTRHRLRTIVTCPGKHISIFSSTHSMRKDYLAIFAIGALSLPVAGFVIASAAASPHVSAPASSGSSVSSADAQVKDDTGTSISSGDVEVKDDASASADTPEANDTPDAKGATNPADKPDAKDTAITSSVTVDDTKELSESADALRIAPLATITADVASKAALAAQAGTVQSVTLENENGNVVYSVIIAQGTQQYDVKVDAGNGKVLKTDAEKADGEKGNDNADTTQD